MMKNATNPMAAIIIEVKIVNQCMDKVVNHYFLIKAALQIGSFT